MLDQIEKALLKYRLVPKQHIAIAALVLLIPLYPILYIWKKPNWSTRTKWLAVGTLVLFIIIVVSTSGTSQNTQPQPVASNSANSESTKPAVEQPAPQPPEPQLPQDPIARMEALVKKVDNKFEVLVVDSKRGWDGPPPYELIANIDGGFCSGAKSLTYDVLKAIYTDPIAEANISRVIVNVRGYTRASLGAEGGKPVSDEIWTRNGPTTTMEELKKRGSSDIKGLPLESQIWGLEYGGCK